MIYVGAMLFGLDLGYDGVGAFDCWQLDEVRFASVMNILSALIPDLILCYRLLLELHTLVIYFCFDWFRCVRQILAILRVRAKDRKLRLGVGLFWIHKRGGSTV